MKFEPKTPKITLKTAFRMLDAMAEVEREEIDGRHELHVRPRPHHTEEFENTAHQPASALTGLGRLVSVHNPRRKQIQTWMNGQLKAVRKMQSALERNRWKIIMPTSERPDNLDELLAQFTRRQTPKQG